MIEKRMILLPLAVEQSSEGIAISDLDGNLEYLNSAFAEMHGYTVNEIVGKNLSIFHTPEQMQEVETANEILKRKGTFKGEIWHAKRDGTIFPALMHNSLIRDDTGKPIGMMGTVRDIADIKKAEKALQKAYDELEQRVTKRTRVIKIQRNALEELNVAMKVLLKKREEDKLIQQEQVLSNVNTLIMPYIEKLKESKINDTQAAFINVIESSLQEIISPFSLRLSSDTLKLTPAEVKIADLIKQGKRTKEIAKMRNVSLKTVSHHRESIREKLGIKNKKVNLQSYLNSLL